MARTKNGAGSARSSVRHGSLRRSNAWLNAGKVLLTTVIVFALSGIAVGAYAVLGLTQKLDTVELAPEDPSAVGAGQQTIDGAFSILLVGSDSRQGQSINDGETGELNDVNLLLHVSEDHKSATVISFPRDLMLPIPSCPGPNGEEGYYPAMSEQQLNTTLMYGGLPCTVLTLEALTGMDIPYAGLVTFDGVIAMSNAIGGVEVCLAQPIVDPNTDLNLEAGTQKLKGKEALQFLRTRYGVGDGSDKSRISNQQVFMSAMVRQLKSADTLGNPMKVWNLAKAGIENMTLSKNMAEISFLQGLAGTVKDIDLSRVNFVQYPTGRHPYQSGRLTPDYASAQILFDVLESGEAFTVTGTGTGVVDGDSGTDETTKADDTTTKPDSAEGGDTTKADKPVELPDSITGQGSDTQTCSAGRTIL